MTRHRSGLPLALLLAACAGPQAPATAPRVPPAQAEAQARATDQAFSATAVAHDARAFAGFIAGDAVFVSRGGVAAGVAAVCNDWSPLLRPGGPTLAWTPDAALSAGSGDLVMTRGAWTLTPADHGPARSGRYVTVWRREADGKLRVVLDASDTPLPAESARAVRQPLRRVLSDDERLGAAAGVLLDGSREVGGFMLVEVREAEGWRVLVEVGSWRPDAP